MNTGDSEILKLYFNGKKIKLDQNQTDQIKQIAQHQITAIIKQKKRRRDNKKMIRRWHKHHLFYPWNIKNDQCEICSCPNSEEPRNSKGYSHTIDLLVSGYLREVNRVNNPKAITHMCLDYCQYDWMSAPPYFSKYDPPHGIIHINLLKKFVVLPINDHMVHYHISNIKGCRIWTDSSETYLSIHFMHPAPHSHTPRSHFIMEYTFKNQGRAHLLHCYERINDLLNEKVPIPNSWSGPTM
eukprot:102182_1